MRSFVTMALAAFALVQVEAQTLDDDHHGRSSEDAAQMEAFKAGVETVDVDMNTGETFNDAANTGEVYVVADED